MSLGIVSWVSKIYQPLRTTSMDHEAVNILHPTGVAECEAEPRLKAMTQNINENT
jgi:hypothetical protein